MYFSFAAFFPLGLKFSRGIAPYVITDAGNIREKIAFQATEIFVLFISLINALFCISGLSGLIILQICNFNETKYSGLNFVCYRPLSVSKLFQSCPRHLGRVAKFACSLQSLLLIEDNEAQMWQSILELSN